jgi:hypothetical protein
VIPDLGLMIQSYVQKASERFKPGALEAGEGTTEGARPYSGGSNVYSAPYRPSDMSETPSLAGRGRYNRIFPALRYDDGTVLYGKTHHFSIYEFGKQMGRAPYTEDGWYDAKTQSFLTRDQLRNLQDEKADRIDQYLRTRSKR